MLCYIFHAGVINMKEDLRMVCLVPYNLSPIQQGIQSLHGVVEYSLNWKPSDLRDKDYVDMYTKWAKTHKTVIILNAGTTGFESTMEAHKFNLDKLKVRYSIFQEPDLNNALTCIAFIVDYKEDTHIVGYLKQMRLA